MRLKTLVTQFKRELWENRTGFIYTPVIISLLYLALVFAVSLFVLPVDGKLDIQAGNDRIEFHDAQSNDPTAKGTTGAHHSRGLGLLSAAVLQDPLAFSTVLKSVVGVTAVFVGVAFLAVLLAYAHSCLFDDRKNREILFWRSMPVSETTVVLVKLGFLFFTAPIVLLVLNTVISLLVTVFGLVFFTFKGVAISDMVQAVFSHGAIFTPFSIFIGSMFSGLALLPISGYILFCSAYARRSPAILSSLIPILLAAADKTFSVVLGINLHINEIIGRYFKFLGEVFSSSGELSLSMLHNTGNLMVAIAVGFAFIGAAIWLRNNRYEI